MAGIPIQYRTKDFQNSTYKKCSPLAIFGAWNAASYNMSKFIKPKIAIFWKKIPPQFNYYTT